MGDIIRTLKAAADISIPKTDGYYKKCPVPWWNDRCEQIKDERKKAERKMKNNNTAFNSMEYKRIRGLSK
ncbi:hypothetical protein, partial [Klebsiella pneumoniae]|uniref:hypothetical protein n=1 Tax=Klebsiella pneumoniae TaxID=573 RepID=UPI003EBCB90D